MSAQSGIKFEFMVQQFLLSANVPCVTHGLLRKGNSTAPSECLLVLHHLLTFLRQMYGHPTSFKVFTDAEGQADHGGHSSDICISFTSMDVKNDVHISLKNNNSDLKAQRVRNLPNQLGLLPDEMVTYKAGLSLLLKDLVDTYRYARIFSELNEYDKLTVYWRINHYVATWIRKFADNNVNHTRYIRFLLGGNTRYILVNKSKTTEEGEHYMCLYTVPEIKDDVKISRVEEAGESIYVTLSNDFTFRLRLHNDGRLFNEGMLIKYATTLLDLNKRCSPVYKIDKSGISLHVKTFTPKELTAIEQEEARRRKIQ